MQRRNSLYAFITAIGLMVWVGAGSYLFSENCCETSVDTYEGTIKGALSIQDGSTFSIKTEQTIIFPKNKSTPILYKDVSEKLMEVVRYVKSNPIKRLTIVGLVTKDEKKGLGQDRANYVRQLFLNAGTPDYQLRTQEGMREDLLQDQKHGVVLGAVNFIFNSMAAFDVQDPINRFKVTRDNNLPFKYSTASLLLEIPLEMKEALMEIATYLKEQQDRRLIITGHNHPDERNETAFANLGMARANYLRTLLTKFGVKAEQIDVQGISSEKIGIQESKLYPKFLPDPMNYKFETLTAQAKKVFYQNVKRIEADLKEMQVFRFKNFEKENNKIIIDGKLKAYMNDLILYLSSNQKAKVYCVGHSNKLASKEASALKGKERAQYVCEFLLKHGISKERVEVTTAGDSHPLGEEGTQYGQQINRRVDLFISYDGAQPKLFALPPVSTNSTVKKKKSQPQKAPKNKVDSIKLEKVDSL